MAHGPYRQTIGRDGRSRLLAWTKCACGRFAQERTCSGFMYSYRASIRIIARRAMVAGRKGLGQTYRYSPQKMEFGVLNDQCIVVPARQALMVKEEGEPILLAIAKSGVGSPARCRPVSNTGMAAEQDICLLMRKGEFRLQIGSSVATRSLFMPTPKAKIDRVQRLSAEERLSQPSPEEWLQRLDETWLRPGLLLRPSDFPRATAARDFAVERRQSSAD